jgi:hypothetical protein
MAWQRLQVADEKGDLQACSVRCREYKKKSLELPTRGESCFYLGGRVTISPSKKATYYEMLRRLPHLDAFFETTENGPALCRVHSFCEYGNDHSGSEEVRNF